MAVGVQLFKIFKLKHIRNAVHFFQDTHENLRLIDDNSSKLSGIHFSISFTECIEETLQFNMTQTPEMTISQNVC